MIQTVSSGAGPGNRLAMLAGERKIPEPIVVPMTTATALQSPSRRGSADGGSTGGGGDSRMRQNATIRVEFAEENVVS